MEKIFSKSEKTKMVFLITSTNEREYGVDVVGVDDTKELGVFGIDDKVVLDRMHNGSSITEGKVCEMFVSEILYDSDNELYIQRLK